MTQDFHPEWQQRLRRWLSTPGTAVTMRLWVRALGGVYLVAFLILVGQVDETLAASGLLPAQTYLQAVRADFWTLPSVFWLDASDITLYVAAWLGVGLACIAVAGRATAPVMLLLWALQLSFVHVGREFWGFGWETLLLEAGFLAIFAVPAWRPDRSFSAPMAVTWLARWLTFRVMFGAGLIKLRGDSCWWDLTCLDFHFETQPNPHPLSWFLHHLPHPVLAGGVLVNHVVELAVPFLIFGPARARRLAGVTIMAFQALLILSGNLAFLNWLTLAVAVACLDDAFLRVDAREASVLGRGRRRYVTGILVAGVALLSVQPVANLFSNRQIMNGSFDRLHLVNTYGAFGSVGRQRDELVIEGSASHDGDDWRAYDFRCKPGPLDEPPCLITPYHYRVDWQIWFAAMSQPADHLWLAHLVFKLLADEPIDVFEHNPFPAQPPKRVRVRRYTYAFTDDLSQGWWTRAGGEVWLGPVTTDDLDELRGLLEARGIRSPQFAQAPETR